MARRGVPQAGAGPQRSLGRRLPLFFAGQRRQRVVHHFPRPGQGAGRRGQERGHRELEDRVKHGAWGMGHGVKNSKGFTLVELVVVIVVLGIMVALVIPRLGELGEANLKRSARHITGMVRFLRDDAQAKKTVYRLRFDIQGGRYWAEALTAISDKAAEFKRLQSVMVNEGSLSGQTTFKDVKTGRHPCAPYLLFSPNGAVDT